MYRIGIDIGGTTVKAGVVSEERKIVHKVNIPTVKGDVDGFIKSILDLLEELLAGAQLKMQDVHRIGVGCPGIVDSETGIVMDADNLELSYLPLKELLERALLMPVTVNNDANCAAWGEYLALSDDNINSLVMVTLGTGIGGGIILNKELYTGCDGSAGEWGCMIMDIGRAEVSLGSKRYWENYASASALVRFAEKAAEKCPDSLLNVLIKQNEGKADGKLFFQALEQKDVTAVTVFRDYIQWLGDGLINILYIFRPEVLVIGGGLSHAELLWEPLNQYLAENSDWFQRSKQTRICKAVMGNDAGTIGAAFL